MPGATAAGDTRPVQRGPSAGGPMHRWRTNTATPVTIAVDSKLGGLVSESPLVSIIVPAYNAARYLPLALRSVARQTHRNIEILVVDDGSSDRTLALARAFAADDRRVRILSQANSGVAAARNLAIGEARGEWIAPIDADDIWHPNKIAQQLEAGRSPSVGLVYSWSVDIDASGMPIGDICVSNIRGAVMPTLLAHNFIGSASVPLLRRTWLDKAGWYDTIYHQHNAQGCEDWDLSLRLAECSEFAVVPQFHVGYRKTGDTMSCDYTKMRRSHALLLERSRTRQTTIPEFVYRMSRGNLYTYFSRQSRAHGDHRQALSWLVRSLRADKWTPLLRLTLYQLLVSSLWGLVRDRSRGDPRTAPASALDRRPAADDFPAVASTAAVRLELLRNTLFHKGVTVLSRKMAPR